MFGENKFLFKQFVLTILFTSMYFCLKGMDFPDESSPLLPNQHSINSSSSNDDSLMQHPEKLNEFFCSPKSVMFRQNLIIQTTFFLNKTLLTNSNFIFDKWVEKITNNNLRNELIKNLIDLTTDHLGSMKIIFDKQPEGLLKNIIRMIHFKLTKKLIDKYNISFINLALEDAEKDGDLDLTALFWADYMQPKNEQLKPLLTYLFEIMPVLCKKPIKLLELCGNELDKLPKTICCFQDLVQINLLKNEFKHFPKILEQLKQLKRVALDKNLEKELKYSQEKLYSFEFIFI